MHKTVDNSRESVDVPALIDFNALNSTRFLEIGSTLSSLVTEYSKNIGSHLCEEISSICNNKCIETKAGTHGNFIAAELFARVSKIASTNAQESFFAVSSYESLHSNKLQIIHNHRKC